MFFSHSIQNLNLKENECYSQVKLLCFGLVRHGGSKLDKLVDILIEI